MPLALLVFALLAGHPRCVARGDLPDPVCTPGAVDTGDLAVICGTSTRGRRHVTEATKRTVLAEYGFAWSDRSRFEIDHLIPLEAGGANVLANLWPEPIDAAHEKDHAEGRLHARICSGVLAPAEGQKRFAADWTKE